MQPSENPAAVLPWVLRGKLYAAKHFHDGDVADWMIRNRAPAAAVRIFKAGIPVGSTLDPDYNSAVTAFIASAATTSAFFRLLADRAVRSVPLRSRVMITTSPGLAVEVMEGFAKPLSAVQTKTVVLEPRKAVGQAAFSNELWLDLSAAGQQQMHLDLVACVSKAVDALFLQAITSTGTSSAASSGPTAADAWADLRTALSVVNTSGGGKLYWLLSPSVANRAATLDAAGINVFPAMGPTSGEIVGLPALVSAGVPSGELYLLDASRILANSDTIVARTSSQADMLLSDTPNMSSTGPTAAAMTSLWQTDSTGIQTEAVIGAQVLHLDPNDADDPVHITTGINWGAGP